MNTRKPLNHIAAFVVSTLLAALAIVTPTNANADTVKYECGPRTSVPVCPNRVQVVNDEDNTIEYECGPRTSVPVCPRHIVVTEKSPPPPPPAEICDGLDNDGDGETDEGRLCPDGYTCHGRFNCLPNIPSPLRAPASTPLSTEDRSTLDHWSHFRLLPGVMVQHTFLLDGVTTVGAGARGVLLFNGEDHGVRLELGVYFGGASIGYRDDEKIFAFDSDLLLGARFGDFVAGAGYLFEVASDQDTSTTQGHFGVLDVGYYFGEHFRLDARVLPYGYRIVSDTHRRDGEISIKQADDRGFGGVNLLASYQF